ncbi:hypothetical protein MMC30_004444 [Trapelia coarctata]|nr:hypothetical protein [Trapelia coarctata]
MEGLSSSPNAPPSPPRLGRVTGAENLPPQQDNAAGPSRGSHSPPSPPLPGRVIHVETPPPQRDIAGPSGSSSPPPWPPRPGTISQSEINPVEDEAAKPLYAPRPPYAPRPRRPGTISTFEIAPAQKNVARPPYAPSSPGRPGTMQISEITPAEAMRGGPSRPSSPPAHQAITISEISPAQAEDPTQRQSPPHSPHSPHSPPRQQHSFEIDTPQQQSATRRRCAAIVNAFNTHDMTEEERRGAAFCCRFLLGACMVGVGAGVRNDFGAGVAVGGAVQWAEALQKLYVPAKKSTTTTAATHEPTATPGSATPPGSATLPGSSREPVTRRRGWKKEGGLQERGTPPGSPRSGSPHHPSTGPAEGESQGLIASSGASPSSPQPLSIEHPSPPSPRVHLKRPSPPPSPPSTPLNPSTPQPAPSSPSSPARRRCAALSHLAPSHLTIEQRALVSYCCKWFAASCLLGTGALIGNPKAALTLSGAGLVAAGSALKDVYVLAREGRDARVRAQVGYTTPVEAGPEGYAMHPLENVLRRRGVGGGLRGGMGSVGRGRVMGVEGRRKGWWPVEGGYVVR